MAAALQGHFDLVRQLLEYGADVSLDNHAGECVLDMLGSGPGNSAMVELCHQYMKPILK